MKETESQSPWIKQYAMVMVVVMEEEETEYHYRSLSFFIIFDLATKINLIISLLQPYDVGCYTRARRNNTRSNGEEGVQEEGHRDTSLWTL